MKQGMNFAYGENCAAKMEKEIDAAPILKSILASMPIAVNLWDKNMKNILCNNQVLNIFNLKDEKEYLENFSKFSPEIQPNGVPTIDMMKFNFDKAIEEGINVFNWMHQTLDQELIPCEITLIEFHAYDESYLVGFIRDLSNAFLQIDDIDYDYYFRDNLPINILLNEIQSLSSEWFFSVDLRTKEIKQFVHESESKSFNLKDDFKIADILNGGAINSDNNAFAEKIKNKSDEPYEVKIQNKKGEYRYHKIIHKVLNDKEGKPAFVVGKGIDIHEQKTLEERSQRDLLTKCYNKISAQELISEKLNRSKKYKHALFMIDIDNFKGLNDNLGHFFGDNVLFEIAEGLRSVFRDNDIIARVGGDEFLVFLENVNSQDILAEKANKILAIFDKTFPGEFRDYSISGSVGIAVFPNDGENYVTLYQNADKALYQAKFSGKNRFVIYSQELRSGTMSNTTKIENAERMAGAYFDYDLISAVFNILYDKNGDDSSINHALKYICQKYDADRSYIFETLDNGKTFDNTFEYCKKGVSSEIASLKSIPTEEFDDFVEKAHNGVIYSNNLRETLEADFAFETMARQGIQSFVHVQVKKDGAMTFFIGLDDCGKTRVWTEREINSLQYIGKLISLILQGTHLLEKVNTLAETNKNSTHILDNTDNTIYISDIETYDLLYLNQKGKKTTGIKNVKGRKCYEALQGLSAPCDFCTNHLLNQEEFYEWSHHNESLNSTFLLKDKLIRFNGKLARLEIATNISKIVTLESELQEKLEDERFLANCIEMLHSGNEPNVSTYKLLQSVAGYYNAERSYIFEVSDCKQYINNTYEWCDEEIPKYKDILQDLPISSLDFLCDKCKKLISFVLDINDKGLDKNSLEYQLMKRQKLKKVLVCAIVSKDNEITGFVGVDNPKINTEKFSIIQSVAKFTANFLDENELVAKLNKLSYYDNLTGLKNRQSYSDAIRLINKKNIQTLGIIYIDIKGLRAINDSKGFLMGDSIINRLSGILQSIYNDDVYRVGGDEFVVFLENIMENDFESKIEELRERLTHERDFNVTIGYTWNKNSASSELDVYNEHNGNEKYSRILRENLEMEIADGKFEVFLQPQVEIQTGEIVSAEALVRRIGAGGKYQPPISFIPFYEKEGLISKIDTFVFETVCKTIKEWKAKGCNQISSIAVNCSRMTIAEDFIVEKFTDICNKYGVDKSQIVIEITETTNEISENVLSHIIHCFKDAGFLISLDDFGSGYSNLTSFVISDFDEVKIDMKLINDVHTNEKSKALTQVVLVLCEKLNNLISVAEGVECVEQHETLKQLGCIKGQGYYFDKPMHVDDFSKKYVNDIKVKR